VVLEQLHGARRDSDARADNVFGSGSLGPRIRLAVARSLPIPPSSLRPVARAVDASVTSAVMTDLDATTQPPAGATAGDLDAWAQTTAARVSAFEEALVDQAMAAAEGASDPVAAARAALEKAEDRAALLARDATGDLVAAVTQTRAQQLGSDRYVWRSQEDDRVRPLHDELDDTIRSWDDPHPTEGHPGDAPNCRCWAQALPIGEGP
jgi:SPP1 gp7 family putative phage head morphogenesis protein